MFFLCQLFKNTMEEMLGAKLYSASAGDMLSCVLFF